MPTTTAVPVLVNVTLGSPEKLKPGSIPKVPVVHVCPPSRVVYYPISTFPLR